MGLIWGKKILQITSKFLEMIVIISLQNGGNNTFEIKLVKPVTSPPPWKNLVHTPDCKKF